MLDTLHWIPSHQQYLYHLKSRWRNSHVLVKIIAPYKSPPNIGSGDRHRSFHCGVSFAAAARVTFEAASGLVTLKPAGFFRFQETRETLQSSHQRWEVPKIIDSTKMSNRSPEIFFWVVHRKIIRWWDSLKKTWFEMEFYTHVPISKYIYIQIPVSWCKTNKTFRNLAFDTLSEDMDPSENTTLFKRNFWTPQKYSHCKKW